MNEILSYSVVDGKLLLVYDLQYISTNLDQIYLQELSINVNDLNSQENINNVAENLSKSSFASSPLATIIKTSSNITVDGVEYSKDGIDGDNPFARRCGITNAVKTYVSGLGGLSFANTSTQYWQTIRVLVLSETNGEFNVTKAEFVAESDLGYTDEQVYKNLLINNDIEKSYLRTPMQIVNLGENMKK